MESYQLHQTAECVFAWSCYVIVDSGDDSINIICYHCLL